MTLTKVHMTIQLVYRCKLLITHFKSLVELVSTFGFVPAREGLVISSPCTCAACMWIYSFHFLSNPVAVTKIKYVLDDLSAMVIVA